MESTRSRSRSPLGSVPKRRNRVSYSQLEVLIGYLETNHELAKGYVGSSMQGLQKAHNGWQTVTDILNAVRGGAHKNWKGWSQVLHAEDDNTETAPTSVGQTEPALRACNAKNNPIPSGSR